MVWRCFTDEIGGNPLIHIIIGINFYYWSDPLPHTRYFESTLVTIFHTNKTKIVLDFQLVLLARSRINDVIECRHGAKKNYELIKPKHFGIYFAKSCTKIFDINDEVTTKIK